MTISEKIQNDFKEAFKAKNQIKLSTLKMLRAEIHNAEIAKHTRLVKSSDGGIVEDESCELNDEEILQVISREIKKRKDAVDVYAKASREEMAEKEKEEMAILADYMPEQMKEEELKELIKNAIKDIGASGPKDTGKVMAMVMAQVKGKADGSIVGKIVKEYLG